MVRTIASPARAQWHFARPPVARRTESLRILKLFSDVVYGALLANQTNPVTSASVAETLPPERLRDFPIACGQALRGRVCRHVA
jgi:hypothetical protein